MVRGEATICVLETPVRRLPFPELEPEETLTAWVYEHQKPLIIRSSIEKPAFLVYPILNKCQTAAMRLTFSRSIGRPPTFEKIQLRGPIVMLTHRLFQEPRG